MGILQGNIKINVCRMLVVELAEYGLMPVVMMMVVQVHCFVAGLTEATNLKKVVVLVFIVLVLILQEINLYIEIIASIFSLTIMWCICGFAQANLFLSTYKHYSYMERHESSYFYICFRYIILRRQR